MYSKLRKSVAVCLCLMAFCSLLAAEPNGIDRLTMQPYNEAISDVSTLLTGAALCAPGLLALPALQKGDVPQVLSLGLQYALVMGGSWATKEVLKTSVARPRPYMYYENPPQDKIAEGEWNRSFPSGHTTAAFAAAAFTVYSFNDLFPESSWNWAVGTAAYGTAAAIATLRVASGSHFVTDVAAGAAIGTLWGYGIPLLNRRVAVGSVGSWFTATPTGFTAAIQW